MTVRDLSRTASDSHARVVTPSPSTEPVLSIDGACPERSRRGLRINSAKGLGVRFFAALRMTVLKSLIVKCTNALHSGLVAAFAGLIALGTVWGCDRLPGKPALAERWTPAMEVTDFSRLYAQNCSGCHGADGRLGAARPLNDPLYLALVG